MFIKKSADTTFEKSIEILKLNINQVDSLAVDLEMSVTDLEMSGAERSMTERESFLRAAGVRLVSRTSLTVSWSGSGSTSGQICSAGFDHKYDLRVCFEANEASDMQMTAGGNLCT